VAHLQRCDPIPSSSGSGYSFVRRD
jgi:hypothetical protein